MEVFEISDLYFKNVDILDFWQHENTILAEHKQEEFLKSTEVSELVKKTKSAVLQGFCSNQRIYSSSVVKELRKVHSMDCQIWTTKTHGFVLAGKYNSSVVGRNKDTGALTFGPANKWDFESSANRTEYLMEKWQALYGELSMKHKLSFQSNSEVAEIVKYELNHVLQRLSENRKVQDLLNSLRNSGCQYVWFPELGEDLQGAIKINLDGEAIRAERLFKTLNEYFKNEIEQKNRVGKSPYMDLKSKGTSTIDAWGGRYVCNSCGAIIGLLNDHNC